MLRNLQHIAGKPAAQIAYYGFVESVLRYGIMLWGHSTDILSFSCQKKCIRAYITLLCTFSDKKKTFMTTGFMSAVV